MLSGNGQPLRARSKRNDRSLWRERGRSFLFVYVVKNSPADLKGNKDRPTQKAEQCNRLCQCHELFPLSQKRIGGTENKKFTSPVRHGRADRLPLDNILIRYYIKEPE